MYMIAIAVLGAMLLTWSLAITQPQETAFHMQVKADSVAANFWAYRDALVAYQNAYPTTASVQITPLALAAFLPTGYQDLNRWSHYFDENRKLYTYSKTAADNLPEAAAIDAIGNRRGRSLMIGIADNTGTTMTGTFVLTGTKLTKPDGSPDNYTQDPTVTSQVSFPLPSAASIPARALVVIGS